MSVTTAIIEPRPAPVSKNPTDRIVYIFLGSGLVALLAIWIFVTSFGAALTYYMINQKHAKISGTLVIEREERPKQIQQYMGKYRISGVGYKYTDPDGNVWRRSLHRFPPQYLKFKTGRKIKLLFNPDHPQFFAMRHEIAGLISNYKLMFLGLFLLGFSGMIAYYAYWENRILKRKQKHAARLRYARSFNE